MSISNENSPLIGRYVIDVKIGKKWVQCTNTMSLPEARAEVAAKKKAAPDCKFRIMVITTSGYEEVTS